MKRIVFVFALFSIMTGMAQNSVNGYKYVIVPKKFDFLKKEDQYQMNALTKFLFEKYGFKAVYGHDLPEEIEGNSCLAVRADVKDNSNMFTTKLNVELTNCRGETVFVSEEGKSKEKDFKSAYHEALRNAFGSVEALGYSYDPSLSIASRRRAVTNTSPAVKDNAPVSVPSGNAAVQANRSPERVMVTATDVLYAQQVENGYQLVDSSPKVVFVLQSTSAEDVFIIKDKNGMLTKKEGKWIAEYYEDGQRVEQELNIKF